MMRRGQVGLAALAAALLISVIAPFALPAAAIASVDAQTAAPAAQSAAAVIDSADLRLWPEYDDPGLLVILSGEFAPGTPTPLQVAFPIPDGARNIQATYQDETGNLINRPFEVTDGKLAYELPTSAFHIEYYLDRAPSGEQRDIKYAFAAPYAINALRVAVQQPARASGFTLTPASDEPLTGSDGLTYFGFTRRNLAAGETVDINARYTKPDDGLTAPQLAVAPSTAANGSTAGSSAAAPAAASASPNWLAWGLIGLGVVLLAAVLTYWLLTQRRQPAPAPAAPEVGRRPVQATAPAPPRRASVAAQPASDAVSYCTNCGHPLRLDDRFCSQCGAPRRS
jgi:hypothetical protein